MPKVGSVTMPKEELCQRCMNRGRHTDADYFAQVGPNRLWVFLCPG